MMTPNNSSTLVLLPGMDGTGKLFVPLLKHLKEFQCKVISLPQTGAQDYSTLTEYVKQRLPTDDFILIAESFSGPIAAQLTQEKIDKLKGIIFVATFLSSPNKNLLNLAKRLPIKFLLTLPMADFFIKKLFLGNEADKAIIQKFQLIVNQVPTKVLKQRMRIMQALDFRKFNSSLPTCYIQPKSDRLVRVNKVTELQECFKNLVVKHIEGPHFILQSNRKKSADIILNFICGL